METSRLPERLVRQLSFLRVSFVPGGQLAPLNSVTRALIDRSACLVEPSFLTGAVLQHIQRRVHGRCSRLSWSRVHELRCREALFEGKVLKVLCVPLSVCFEGFTVLSSLSRLPATSDAAGLWAYPPRPGIGVHVVTTVKSTLLPLRGTPAVPKLHLLFLLSRIELESVSAWQQSSLGNTRLSSSQQLGSVMNCFFDQLQAVDGSSNRSGQCSSPAEIVRQSLSVRPA